MKEKILLELKKKGYVVSDLALNTMLEIIIPQDATDEQFTEILEKSSKLAATIQADTDRKTADLHKQISEVKKLKIEPAKAPEPPKVEQASAGETVPMWVQSLIDAQKVMQDEILSLRNEKTSQTLHSKLQEKLKEIPDTFKRSALIGRKFNDESEVDELANTITDDFKAYQQELTSKGLLTMPKTEPTQQAKDKQVADAMKKVIEQKTKKS